MFTLVVVLLVVGFAAMAVALWCALVMSSFDVDSIDNVSEGWLQSHIREDR